MSSFSVPRRRAAVLATVLLAAALLTPYTAEAMEPPIVSADRVPAAADFATSTYGQPWDMERSTDVRLSRDRTINVRSARYEDGLLRVTGAGGVILLTMVFPGYPGAHYVAREGGHQPIDADRFTHVTMRVRVPRPMHPEISWDRSLADEPPRFHPDTQRSSPGRVEPGWRTVTHPVGWTGLAYSLRLSFPLQEGDLLDIDYVRVHTPPQSVDVTYDPAGALYWDRDDDPDNNDAPENPDWGPVPGASGGRATFVAGAHKPGVYRFFTVRDDLRSPYSAPLDVKAAPAPRILDPDLTGGEDYATAHLGNPWDFSDISDVVHVANVSNASFGPTGLNATNGPPNQNDPYLYLRVGPGGIDPNRYHRLTVHSTYEGELDLGDYPGGGTHARLGWGGGDNLSDPNERPGPGRRDVIDGNKLVQTREFVHFGDESYTVDLRTDPPGALMETDLPSRQGWPGARVHYLRYDPNEDPGARRWRVARIELRATDATDDAKFDIRWEDANPDRPEQTQIALFAERDGGTRTPIATDVAQTAGVNTYRWDTRGWPRGRYWIVMVATDGMTTTETRSSGPVDVSPDLRVRGPERIATAVALARMGFPGQAPAVVVARDREFADALAAAPLAAAARGPLLLNPVAALHAGVRAEIVRLGARTVYLMGGHAAQAPAVEESLRQIPGVQVVRVSGPDRFGTAAAAAGHAVGLWRQQGDADAGQRVLVALGTDFPDALGAGPLAGHSRQPLLLVTRGTAPQATLDALAGLGARSVTVVGGSAAISDAVVRQLGRPARRLAGATRYDTAAVVAAEATRAGGDARVLVVASGRSFADALAAGPAIVARGGVLLLTDPAALSAPTRQWVAERRGQMQLLRVAGGTAAISDAVEDALAATMR